MIGDYYHRVLPRDLFNEAKLLKCLGRLCLWAHDYPGLGLRFDLRPDGPFDIRQHQDSGDLYCRNLQVDGPGGPWALWVPYNSRDPWPLRFYREGDDDDDGRLVFTDTGWPSVELCRALGISMELRGRMAGFGDQPAEMGADREP